MFYKNNWFSYSYDGIEFGNKLDFNSKFTIDIKPTITNVKTYHEELIENAKKIRDIISGPLDLLFSGGIDSEVILRLYNDLKIPLNVFIFKYENEYNHREFSHALKICDKLNITPKIIDFNLKKFFENEAYDYWIKVKCNSSSWLPHMKMLEYLNGTPIIGSGEPYWRRTSRDLTKKANWLYEISESAKSWTIYGKFIKRDIISDWYEYSPEIIISHLNLPLIQKLTNDQISGKLSSLSSKAVLHKDIWPDIEIRPKLVGFEGNMPPGYNSKPDFMLDFDNKHGNSVEYQTYCFSEEEIKNKLII